jgi:AraC-like DNA-binding protein
MSLVTFDKQKITAALQDFYNATGIDMDLLKADFSPVDRYRTTNSCYCSLIQSCPKGKEACRRSDIALLEACKNTGSLSMHVCHAGLLDAAIPIHYNDTIIGYIVFGRMKPDTDFAALEKYVSSLGIDISEASIAFHQIPFYNEEKIRSVSNIATLLVKYILLENLLIPPADSIAEKVVTFIEKNLDTELSIQSISRDTNISKSVLYKTFHTRYHCTVGAYINDIRVQRSIEYLLKTSLSMEEIAQRVGFSSGSYYSKIFKKQMGSSPLQYRKNNSGR